MVGVVTCGEDEVAISERERRQVVIDGEDRVKKRVELVQRQALAGFHKRRGTVERIG